MWSVPQYHPLLPGELPSVALQALLLYQGKQPLATLSSPFLKAELLALLILETHPPSLAL